MNETDNNYADVLATELGYEAETATPPTPAEPPAGDDAGQSDSQQTTAVEDEQQQVQPPAGPPKPEETPTPPADGTPPATPPATPTPEEKANAEGQQAATPPEAPAPLTAEDIRAAIQADREQVSQRVNAVSTARNEIIEKMYPQGIDQNIYDSNGNIIKTAQDIVDRGILKDDGEPYTYEEAASFVLRASQEMAKNVEELNQWADNIAEQNISLAESNARVISKWGDILKAMPDVAQKLASDYISTQLEFDKTKSFITRMGMAPEQFYDIALGPYRKLGEALAEKQALEAQQQQQQQESEQQERNGGIPPQRGTSDTPPNTGDPMLDALLVELGKD